MVDFLVAVAQGISIGGLIYGAYLSVTYSHSEHRKTRGRADSLNPPQPAGPTRAKSESAVRSEDSGHVRA